MKVLIANVVFIALVLAALFYFSVKDYPCTEAERGQIRINNLRNRQLEQCDGHLWQLNVRIPGQP